MSFYALPVILSAAKNLSSGHAEILRCAQNDNSNTGWYYSFCFPPRIERGDRHIAFMLGDAITLFDALRYAGGNLFPFEIIIYHFVAHAEFIFVKLTRIIVKQVGGGLLCINPFIGPKIFQ